MQPQPASVQDSVVHINVAPSEISDTSSVQDLDMVMNHFSTRPRSILETYNINLVHNLISYTSYSTIAKCTLLASIMFS